MVLRLFQRILSGNHSVQYLPELHTEFPAYAGSGRFPAKQAAVPYRALDRRFLNWEFCFILSIMYFFLKISMQSFARVLT